MIKANKFKLDKSIFEMESKLSEIYRQKTSKLNYQN